MLLLAKQFCNHSFFFSPAAFIAKDHLWRVLCVQNSQETGKISQRPCPLLVSEPCLETADSEARQHFCKAWLCLAVTSAHLSPSATALPVGINRALSLLGHWGINSPASRVTLITDTSGGMTLYPVRGPQGGERDITQQLGGCAQRMVQVVCGHTTCGW